MACVQGLSKVSRYTVSDTLYLIQLHYPTTDDFSGMNFDILKENRKSKRQARAWKNLKALIQFIGQLISLGHFGPTGDF